MARETCGGRAGSCGPDYSDIESSVADFLVEWTISDFRRRNTRGSVAKEAA